jgi:hypothetical protein
VTEQGAVIDALGRDAPDVIPGDVVRELVARKEQEIEALLAELDDARREAEESERQLRDHPALVGADPSIPEGATVATTPADVGPTDDPPDREAPGWAGPGNGATGVRPAAFRPGTLATIQASGATGVEAAPDRTPALATTTPAPATAARTTTRPRTTVDTRARAAGADVGVSQVAHPVSPTAGVGPDPSSDGREGVAEWFRTHLMFKAGIAVTLSPSCC